MKPEEIPREFIPFCRESPLGCLEAVWEDCLYVATPINEDIILYRKESPEGEIVGVRLKSRM